MEQHTYRYLEPLVGSDFQIVDGEPDIVGWKVNSETGAYLGKVKDLLFDPQSNSVRYIIMDLNDNGMHLDDKKVMIPIGIAHLHTKDDEVVLPNVHQDQFSALPNYNDGKIGPDTEVSVRDIIGSPAALRIEDKTAEFDQNKFYSHEHFNKDNFYMRGGNPNRAIEQHSMDEMIQNSDHNDLNSLNDETRSHDADYTTKPWLEPGAGHNQGGDHNNSPDRGQLDSDGKPYLP